MNFKKVLISGGREQGGLNSFAAGLLEGFRELGLSGTVLPMGGLLRQWRDLRDPDVLKILSTGAVFLSPFCKSALCVAHGIPRADVQGVFKTILIVLSLALAQRFGRLVAVSDYVRLHLRAVFRVTCHHTIPNPIASVYTRPHGEPCKRRFITYVGRLHKVKNIDKLIEPVRAVLSAHPDLTFLIIGEGDMHQVLKKMIGGDSRIVLAGRQSPESIVRYLQQTALFVSGCGTEALGISYLEALSQGCKVAMPASGGGLEIDLAEVQRRIVLLPIDLAPSPCTQILLQAVHEKNFEPYDVTPFYPSAIAKHYLDAASKPSGL